MKRVVFILLAIVCSTAIGRAQDEKPFLYVTNDFTLPTDAVLSGPPMPPPGFGGETQANSPTPSVSFLGLSDNVTVQPPDTQGAVGLSNLVTMLNSQVRIHDRSGTALATTNLSGFWNGVGSYNNITDPRIVYDPFANRWIASAMVNYNQYDTNHALLLAVSRDANPAFTNWYQYRFRTDTSGSVWADQPVIGFNKDWIVMQANLARTVSNSGYGTLILIFTKTNLYSGLSASFRSKVYTNIGYSQTPAVTLDNSVTNLFLAQNLAGRYPLVSGGQTNYVGIMRLYEIYGPVGTESIRAFEHYATNTPWADAPPVEDFAPQLGLNLKIMNNDSRVRSVITRDNTIWCAHNIFLPATNASRTSVQWWQFNTDGSVRQTSRIDDPAGIRFFAFPSVAVNRFGDALVGYSSFATNQYASASYSYRNYNDQGGTLQLENIYWQGDGIYYRTASRQRWGDYSATVVDPLNDADFWTIQEYAATPVSPGTTLGNGRWGTWWAKLEVSKPGNDFFTNSYQVSGSSGTTNGNNIRATKESGEPNHASDAGTASVWYHWTPPSAGNVIIDTIGSDCSTILAVYTGSSVGVLTLVTNDIGSAGSGASRVVFNAAASTTYRIAVDGVSGGMGNIVLNFKQPTTPVFVTDPQSQTKYQGDTVTFTSQAVGNPNPAYQWRFNSANISGATSSSYTKSNLSTNDAGNYTVVATNTSGSVTSAVAALTILTSEATLSGPVVTNNTFQLTVSQVSGLSYIVQANTNLSTTNWTSISTNTAPFTITDTTFTNNPQRFYRAICKP